MITTFNNTNFAVVADIEKHQPYAYHIVRQPHSSIDSDDELQQCIDESKEAELRKHLELYAQKIFPQNISAVISRSRSFVEQAKSREIYDSIENSGLAWYMSEGHIQYMNGYTRSDYYPSLLYYSGTPTNILAKNGTMLIDTVGWRVYINRGNESVPSWSECLSSDALDRIKNPTRLKYAQIYAALWYGAERGMFKNAAINDPSYTEWSAFYQDKFIGELYGTFVNGKKISDGILGVIEFDFSGDDIIQDYERVQRGAILWA